MLNDDSDVSGLCGSEVNPIENTDISDFSDNKSSDSNDTINDSSAYSLLKDIKLKNINRITIGSLNINSISSKFDQLRENLMVAFRKISFSSKNTANHTGLIVIEKGVGF